MLYALTNRQVSMRHQYDGDELGSSPLCFTISSSAAQKYIYVYIYIYTYTQILTNTDKLSTNIDKRCEVLTKTHISNKTHVVFLEKTPAASLKRSKHGLGTPKRAFSKKVRLFSKRNRLRPPVQP